MQIPHWLSHTINVTFSNAIKTVDIEINKNSAVCIYGISGYIDASAQTAKKMHSLIVNYGEYTGSQVLQAIPTDTALRLVNINFSKPK